MTIQDTKPEVYTKDYIKTKTGTQKVTITPDIARRWLGYNIKNRFLSERIAKGYAKQMISGKWQTENGETIKFSSDGMLVDGQHRLKAILLAGINIDLEIRFGISPEAFKTIDTGKKRTGGDVLFVEGIPNANNVSHAIKIISGLQSGYTREKTRENSLSNTEIYEFCIDHPEIIEFVANSRSLYKKSGMIFRQTEIAAFWYLFSQSNVEKADEFIRKMTTGAGVSSDSVILLLRNKFLKDRVNQLSKMKTSVRYAFIIKAWNYFYTGKTRKTLIYQPAEKFPEIL